MNDNQQNLFDTEPEPWQLDDQDDWLAARVVFAEAPWGPYDYRIEGDIERQLKPGMRVYVPLGRGNRSVVGYCVAIINSADELASTVSVKRLKSVLEVKDAQPILSNRLLELSQWISDYYVCPLGTVLETVVPPGVRDGAGTREVLFLSLAHDVADRLDEQKLSKQQRAVLEVLQQGGTDWTTRELAETVGCSTGPINGLRRKALVIASTRRVRSTGQNLARLKRESNLQLNADQQRALSAIEDSIDANRFHCFLMHGITGSGKTEVYIRAIQRVVEFGRQAIVLVPEISLTPQTRQRFRARFDNVAVLHSHLTAAQRAWHWHQIASGDVQVIIGARSAVFAPAPNLGLIVIDEEHDGSFKQDKAPRYHARDVALQRTRRQSVPLILGSATPALESWLRAEQGESDLLSLPRRALDRPLPDVATIDLRSEYGGQKSRTGAISQKLRQEIRAALNDGGQVILLLNRRGYSTRIQCPACGHVEHCPDCSIPLTHHQDGEKAVCHYCDFAMKVPSSCLDCNYKAIRFSGIGTQKLEMEVRALFPDHECLRMDTDTMRKPGSHELVLDRFRNGEISILLGTQMIAKGLDFPNVTLVGVINADTALHFPDFRASERTFALVTQVAGRSGRGEKGGRVLVQTFSPDHKAIVAATQHDYRQFASYERPLREQFGYPPFGTLARLVIRSETESLAGEMAQHLATLAKDAAKTLGLQVRVLGPAKATVEKLRGKFRFHVLLSGKPEQPLQPVVRRIQSMAKEIDDVQWIVDIDPQDML